MIHLVVARRIRRSDRGINRPHKRREYQDKQEEYSPSKHIDVDPYFFHRL
jgi:hypothetical protein